jgi:PPP family 3-phenylpropionic acid transporter
VNRGDAAVAAGYLSYFGAVGVIQPYLPVHLAALGYSAGAIGVLLGLWNAARVIGPLAVAVRADAHADRLRVLRLLGLASLASAAVVATARLPLAVGGALVLLSLSFHGLMPVYDAHAIERLGSRAHRYGRLRLWGSIGFVLTAGATGFLVSARGPGAIRYALVALVALTALVLWTVPRAAAARGPAMGRAEFVRALRDRRLVTFLAVCFLHLAGFGAYYGFYSLYLLGAGYGSGTVGLLWGTGVLAEIALFVAGPRILARRPLPRLLEVSLAATVVRWLLVAAFPGVLGVQVLAQLLHLASFGLFHSVTVLLGPALLPAGATVRAQALVSGIGWGAGGAAGSLLAGALWERLGPQPVFLGAAALAGAAWLLARRSAGDWPARG